jgi:hypothetical protein
MLRKTEKVTYIKIINQKRRMSMQRTRFFLLMALAAGMLVISATPASALGVFSHWQDSEDMSSGFGFGLKHKFQIVPIVAIEARGAWINYGSEGRWPDLDMFPLEIAGRAKFGLFYGGLGTGYYLFSGDFKSDDEVGGFIFTGAEFTLLGLGAFAELRYLTLEPGGDYGRDLTGFGASLGVILPIGK